MGSRSDRDRQLASSLDSRRLSRRRLLETAGVGAGALALGGLAAPRLSRAQDSQTNEVTGDFNWKRDDGVTIKALLNEHPYHRR